ncbi:hypothetical protein Ait01nite_005260 [Actinoplanes italicus]|nr:hypothetical protein Ait01nite_005260 [Actinoplanes italicus]
MVLARQASPSLAGLAQSGGPREWGEGACIGGVPDWLGGTWSSWAGGASTVGPLPGLVEGIGLAGIARH